MVVTPTPPTPSSVPSRVFPLPGWTGPINTHWGVGNVGGSDLMVSGSGIQPVVSMVSGKVSYVASQQTAPHSGGNAVEITGIDGLEYYYAHLAAPLGLKVGDTVAAGQLLGTADSTGDAAGGPPHLHIGIGTRIITGTGSDGGTGAGYNAVAALKALVGSPRANNPDIVSAQAQTSITSGQPAGTIVLGPPPAQPVSMSLADRIKWLAQLLSAAGVPGDKIPVMTAISLAENHGSDPNATSSTNDVGLWQINIPSWVQTLTNVGIISSVNDLKDPVKNAQAAFYVLTHQGLGAWSTFQQGLQNAYLPQVQQALAGLNLDTTPVDGGGGDGTGGDNSSDCVKQCGKWNIGPVSIPDLGCVFQCSVANIINQWKTAWLNWWNNWTQAHAANLLFVGLGAVLLFIGIAATIGQSKAYQNMAKSVAQAGAVAA